MACCVRAIVGSKYMALSRWSRRGVGFVSSWVLIGTAGESGGHLVLSGSATGPLAGDHRSLQEQLTAPPSPGLPPLEGSGQTLGAHRAALAQGLGNLDVLRSLGEEQLRVLTPARQPLLVDLAPRDRVCVEDADTHLCHLLVTCFWFLRSA